MSYNDFRELNRNQRNGRFLGFQSPGLQEKGERRGYFEGSQHFGTCPNGQRSPRRKLLALSAGVQAQKGTGGYYQQCQPDSCTAPAPGVSFKQYLPHSPGEQTQPYHF